MNTVEPAEAASLRPSVYRSPVVALAANHAKTPSSAAHSSVTLAVVAAPQTGADGSIFAVRQVLSALGPQPVLLRARTLIAWAVSAASPPKVWAVAVPAGFSQSAPPFLDTS